MAIKFCIWFWFRSIRNWVLVWLWCEDILFCICMLSAICSQFICCLHSVHAHFNLYTSRITAEQSILVLQKLQACWSLKKKCYLIWSNRSCTRWHECRRFTKCFKFQSRMRGSRVLSVAAAVEVVVCRNHFLEEIIKMTKIWGEALKSDQTLVIFLT